MYKRVNKLFNIGGIQSMIAYFSSSEMYGPAQPVRSLHYIRLWHIMRNEVSLFCRLPVSRYAPRAASVPAPAPTLPAPGPDIDKWLIKT